MRNIIAKPSTIITVSIGNSLIYRGTFFMRFVAVLLSLSAQLFFWKAAFVGRTEIANHTLEGLFGYLILANMSYELSQPHNVMVSDHIQDGSLNHFLLLPYGFLDIMFWKLVGERMAFSLASLLPLVICLFLFWEKISPEFIISPIGVILFIIYTLGGVILHFLMDFNIGLLSFWFQKSDFLFVLKEIAVRILAGLWFPFSLLPSAVQSVFEWLPFQFLGFVPARACLTPSAMQWTTPFILMLWIALLYGLYLWIWNIGIKRYEAFGG
ncbi:MAG: hypothetical protein C5B47_02430 [Verrucomicrobia bacterium]|nr:MAG: hypothetical protein C5B47_02430 [Verrucomicrobiota bacterium]